MITINNTQFRSLEEQVQKNKEDIAAHYQIDRVLADFGIRVIGQLDTEQELEGKVGEEYGDAYAVGATEPYSFYIWTRASEGHPEDYWFNIGPLAIVGPKGADSQVPGPRGQAGSKWYSGSGNPSGNAQNGDHYLQIGTGAVYVYNNGWTYEGSIKGADGVSIKGDKGDKGDVGGFINIVGQVNTVSQLPSPTSLHNLTFAYLVGPTKQLYIQVGQSSETAVWTDMGPMNVATLVTANGEYQNVWDADTKVDKVTVTSAADRVYGVLANQTATSTINIQDYSGFSAPTSSRLARYGTNGRLNVGYPANAYDAANKSYVDAVKVKVIRL